MNHQNSGTFTSDEEQEPKEDLTHLSSELIYKEDGVMKADYRRLFAKDQKTNENRKAELGQFYPPEKATSEFAKKRYEAGVKFVKDMSALAWNESISSEIVSNFVESQKKKNVDAIRAKFNKPKSDAASKDAEQQKNSLPEQNKK